MTICPICNKPAPPGRKYHGHQREKGTCAYKVWAQQTRASDKRKAENDPDWYEKEQFVASGYEPYI